ncbi:MAG: hypothetical protein Q9170_006248 [Blastenia crenularia]
MHQREEVAPNPSICNLPTELLIHVLNLFPTLSLLQLRLVSRHFQNVIIRIVHQRLLLAASLEDRKLILECYHPSAQYTEPYVFCEYLGTPGLSNEREGQGSLYQDLQVERGQLKQLYSRFRPSRADINTGVAPRHPAGDPPGSRTNPIDQASTENAKRDLSDLVIHKVLLDAHELFTQLSITTALVQMGPRRGVFLSFIDIIDKKTPRVWRDWLVGKADESRNNRVHNQHVDVGESHVQSDSIIWADQGKTLGLRVRVQETKWKKEVPVLIHRDEDQPTSYSLELEGSFPSLLATTTGIYHMNALINLLMLQMSFDSRPGVP